MTHPIPDSALDAHIAILGKTGGGKSYTARGLVERLIDLGRRVVVLDSEDLWWSLKADADGEGGGLPVAVLGGRHGDMALSAEQARPLGRLLGTEPLSAVVVSRALSSADRLTFVADFLDELFETNEIPVTIVLEEADTIAAQVPRRGGERARDAAEDMAKRGRARGVSLVMISQRPAAIDKNALTQVGTMICHRLIAPQDRKAVTEWLKGATDSDRAAELLDALPTLATGEAIVWSPEVDVLDKMTMPRIKTFDASATPKGGARKVAPKALAEVDLSALTAAISSPNSKEGEKAAAAIDAAAVEAARAEGHRRGFEEGRMKGYEEGWDALRARVDSVIERIEASPIMVEDDLSPPKVEIEHTPPKFPPLQGKSDPSPTVTHQTRHASPGAKYGGLSKSADRLLAALGAARGPQHYKTAATRAGLSLKSSALPLHRRALTEAGYAVELMDGMMELTPLGRSLAGPPPSIDEWLTRLPGSQRSMLRVLMKYDRSIGLDQIAEEADVSRTSSGLNAGLRNLSDLGLIERRGPGHYEFNRNLRDS